MVNVDDSQANKKRKGEDGKDVNIIQEKDSYGNYKVKASTSSEKNDPTSGTRGKFVGPVTRKRWQEAVQDRVKDYHSYRAQKLNYEFFCHDSSKLSFMQPQSQSILAMQQYQTQFSNVVASDPRTCIRMEPINFNAAMLVDKHMVDNLLYSSSSGKGYRKHRMLKFNVNVNIEYQYIDKKAQPLNYSIVNPAVVNTTKNIVCQSMRNKDNYSPNGIINFNQIKACSETAIDTANEPKNATNWSPYCEFCPFAKQSTGTAYRPAFTVMELRQGIQGNQTQYSMDEAQNEDYSKDENKTKYKTMLYRDIDAKYNSQSTNLLEETDKWTIADPQTNKQSFSRTIEYLNKFYGDYLETIPTNNFSIMREIPLQGNKHYTWRTLQLLEANDYYPMGKFLAELEVEDFQTGQWTEVSPESFNYMFAPIGVTRQYWPYFIHNNGGQTPEFFDGLISYMPVRALVTIEYHCHWHMWDWSDTTYSQFPPSRSLPTAEDELKQIQEERAEIISRQLKTIDNSTFFPDFEKKSEPNKLLMPSAAQEEINVNTEYYKNV